MKLLHLADTHVKSTRRIEDTRRVLWAALDVARENAVDLITHGGDVFDAKSNPEERNLVAEWLIECSEVAPVVIVRGNHDYPGDLDIFRKLEGDSPIYVSDRPEAIQIGEFVIQTLPWMTKTWLAARSPAAATKTETDERAIAAARMLLDGFRSVFEGLPDSAIPVVLSHCQVAGSETSTHQVMIGDAIELAPADLIATGAEFVGLGHIHLPQSWGCVHYPGSTEALNFGESHEHGCNLVTFEDGKLTDVEFVKLPARRMVLVDVDLTAGTPVKPFCVDHDGAIVRVRYKIEAERLHEIDEAMIHGTFKDAHELKIEAVVVHSERVRSTEITAAESTWDMVTAFWTAKGIEVSDTQRQRVRLLLDRIESPADHTDAQQPDDSAEGEGADSEASSPDVLTRTPEVKP